MDQTCFGRSGGFAPTIFPLFQGAGFETAGMVLGIAVMLTSSASEAGHFRPGALPNSASASRRLETYSRPNRAMLGRVLTQSGHGPGLSRGAATVASSPAV